MALQSRSISAVFPDPTGPPMPMRSGPCELDMSGALSVSASSRRTPLLPLSPCGLRHAHNCGNIFLAKRESSLILCDAVHQKDDRIDGRDGLVSRSLWRCTTGQKGALLLQRAVERVTMNLRAAADGRAEWVGLRRSLNKPNATAH